MHGMHGMHSYVMDEHNTNVSLGNGRHSEANVALK